MIRETKLKEALKLCFGPSFKKEEHKSNMEKLVTKGYTAVLGEIKQKIRSAQYGALRTVNKALISLYWDIGRAIVENQKKSKWGISVVEKLANDLQKEFPGIKGLSASSLWRMKMFYQEYKKNEKLAQLVREISWGHNILIMEKCKDELERGFYIQMAFKHGWGRDLLMHQIENQAYEKTFSNQTNFDKTLPTKISKQAKFAVKDEYTFDFLKLGEEYSERQLENAVLTNINRFLQEMGGIFTFLGNQYRLEINDKEYFIDILLYHRKLKCLVAIELKVGEFTPEHIGKMQFYLAVLDDKVRIADENPTIGIILCKSKDATIVEYALKETSRPIGVASYRIVSELPNKLRNELPSPAQILQLLDKCM